MTGCVGGSEPVQLAAKTLLHGWRGGLKLWFGRTGEHRGACSTWMSIGDNGELAVDGSAPARRGLGRCWMLADAGVAGMDGRSAVRRRGLIQP